MLAVVLNWTELYWQVLLHNITSYDLINKYIGELIFWQCEQKQNIIIFLNVECVACLLHWIALISKNVLYKVTRKKMSVHRV